MSKIQNPQNMDLHILTDKRLAKGRPHLDVVREAIEGGAPVIQFRDKEANTRQLIDIGQQLRSLTREKGVILIINDRVDIALAVEADGVHVGPEDMPVHLARKILGPYAIIGVSVGTLEEALRAEEEGASYLGVGSIFATSTKSDAGTPIGTVPLTQIKTRVKIPVIAIGGINQRNVEEVLRAGADGVAVVSAIVGAEDIKEATRSLLAKIRGVKGFKVNSI
jgi:thiamine-phosphate pyrophosphorylase